MSNLEEAMVTFCRGIREIQDSGVEPQVEFEYQPGLSVFLNPTQVPTLRVKFCGIEFIATHEGVHHV